MIFYKGFTLKVDIKTLNNFKAFVIALLKTTHTHTPPTRDRLKIVFKNSVILANSS